MDKKVNTKDIKKVCKPHLYECKYNPERDIQKVSPEGALNLKEAFANHAIPADLQAKEGSFNGIDDPSQILGRPSDMIDAVMMEKSLKSAKEDDYKTS